MSTCTALEISANERPHFSEVHHLGKPVPHHGPRFANHPSRRLVLLEESDRRVVPNQLCESASVHQRVRGRWPQFVEPKLSVIHDHNKDSPPRGELPECCRCVVLGRHEGRQVHDLSVCGHLPWEAPQRVSCRLDLKSVKGAIDGGEVDAHDTSPKTKLLKDHRPWTSTMERPHVGSQQWPNVAVAEFGKSFIFGVHIPHLTTVAHKVKNTVSLNMHHCSHVQVWGRKRKPRGPSPTWSLGDCGPRHHPARAKIALARSLAAR